MLKNMTCFNSFVLIHTSYFLTKFVALTCFFRGCCNSASYSVGSTWISLNPFADQVDQLDVTSQGHQCGNWDQLMATMLEYSFKVRKSPSSSSSIRNHWPQGYVKWHDVEVSATDTWHRALRLVNHVVEINLAVFQNICTQWSCSDQVDQNKFDVTLP